jgi:2-oxoglutarate ferredoxin oxidoreductase subunit alpha
MREGDLERANLILQNKYREIKKKEQRFEGLFLDDAEVILVAYGSMARIAKSLVKLLRSKGKKVGLIRPITLWPFPTNIFKELVVGKKRLKFLVVEMSYGQMVEDVRLALEGKAQVEFFGRSGGGVPTGDEITKMVMRL